MERSLLAALSLTVIAACTAVDDPEPVADAMADDDPAALPSASQAGWTGLTDRDEIIEARRLLMADAERLMKPVDGYSIGQPADEAGLRSAATTLEPMLLALPHLFPPTTNLYDPAVLDPPTIALPAIWQRFPAFKAMAENSEHAAAALGDARDEEALRAASVRLRAACDACHRAFTRPYTRPVVTDADLEFDFESALPPQ